MKNPFFSVIIVTYNRAHFLKIAINSVLQQTFDDYELLIVDDGSTDHTQRVVAQFSDPRIRYFPCSHQGVSSARNTGILKSQGDFICFLDSDDRWRMQKLEVTRAYIKKNSSYRIFHTEELWYRNGSLLAQKSYHKKPTGDVFQEAVRICCVSISTAAIKKDIFNEIGMFDTDLPACEDYDFWLRVTSKLPVLLIPQKLTLKEGGHCDQQSHKYPAMDKFRIYALEKILRDKSLADKNYAIAYDELKRKCEIYTAGARKRGKTDDVKRYTDIIKELKKSNA